MSFLYEYLTTAGIESTPASWTCGAVVVIIFFGVVTILCRLTVPKK